jgi:anti-sigma B factor antagonist
MPDVQASYARGFILVDILTANMMDPGSVAQVAAAIDQLLGQASKPRVAIDFSNVQWMCSIMLGELVVISRRLRDLGGKLALAGMRPELRQVLSVTHLDDLLHTFDTVDVVEWDHC